MGLRPFQTLPGDRSIFAEWHLLLQSAAARHRRNSAVISVFHAVLRQYLRVGSKLGVHACAVIASPPQTMTCGWIYRLVQPVLDLGFDLVAPCYSRQTMEGLLNRAIVSPLHRALYGEQLQNPMGPDFGLSGKLLQQILGRDSIRRRGADQSTLASIAPAAASGGFQVCESYLGIRTQSPTDWATLSSLLSEILGVVFLDMEERATFWQSIRGSKTLPKFGLAEAATADAGTVDIPTLFKSFQLGTQNLQDVWGLILPPTTLLELRRLARSSVDQFRLPDQLWVKIVYDFALGHRLRTISRDHLLRLDYSTVFGMDRFLRARNADGWARGSRLPR